MKMIILMVFIFITMFFFLNMVSAEKFYSADGQKYYEIHNKTIFKYNSNGSLIGTYNTTPIKPVGFFWKSNGNGFYYESEDKKLLYEYSNCSSAWNIKSCILKKVHNMTTHTPILISSFYSKSWFGGLIKRIEYNDGQVNWKIFGITFGKKNQGVKNWEGIMNGSITSLEDKTAQ